MRLPVVVLAPWGRGNKQFDLISCYAAQGTKVTTDTCYHRHFCWLIFANLKWYLHRRENIVCLLLSPVVVIWKDQKVSIEIASLSKIARPTLHVCMSLWGPSFDFYWRCQGSSFNLPCFAEKNRQQFSSFYCRSCERSSISRRLL